MFRTINFMGVRNVAFGVTVLLTVLALFSMFHKGMNYGLDFTGGTLIELTYEKPADLTKVRDELATAGFHDAVVQSFGATTDLLVRMPGDDPLLGNKVAAALGEADSANPAVIKRVEFVGPQVGEELRDQGGLGMLMALGGIMLYLAFRFQWKFAVGAIVSLVHDVIVTMGVLSFFQITFDLTVLAAVLAIIGYSLNDTIIVYDRIRENLQNQPEDNPAPLADIINLSVNQTLGRTIMTSATTLIAALSLTILGGGAIHDFALTMSLGVFIGTFSSVFVSNPILLLLGDTRQYMVARKKVEYERPGEHGVV